MSKHPPSVPRGPSPPILLARSRPQRIVDRPPATVAPLSIAELEAGLRILDAGTAESRAFWNDNLAAFRQTLLIAIRDTANALASRELSGELRQELESQLPALNHYLVAANEYRNGLARRFAADRSERELPSSIN